MPSSDTQFKPGNQAAKGKGNIRKRRALHQHTVFAKAVTDQDIREVAQALLKKAKRGNVQAATLLCKVLFPSSVAEMLQDRETNIGQLVLVMPDDGREGGRLHGKTIDDIDDCDIIDAEAIT